MSQQAPKKNLFSYLDKIMGKDGIKTNNKIELSIDSKTAIVILGIGMGLIIFSHGLGAGIRALTTKK